jgi:hypothetical protein
MNVVRNTRIFASFSWFQVSAEKYVKESKKKDFFLNFLTLEDGSDRLFRNVGRELPVYAA